MTNPASTALGHEAFGFPRASKNQICRAKVSLQEAVQAKACRRPLGLEPHNCRCSLLLKGLHLGGVNVASVTKVGKELTHRPRSPPLTCYSVLWLQLPFKPSHLRKPIPFTHSYPPPSSAQARYLGRVKLLGRTTVQHILL